MRRLGSVGIGVGVIVAVIGLRWMFSPPAFLSGLWYAVGPTLFALGSSLAMVVGVRSGRASNSGPGEPFAYRPVVFASGMAAALVGFWFVFWPPGLIDEAPWYAIGPLLLAFGTAAATLQLSVRPLAGVEERMAPAEIGAWLLLVYTAAIAAWILVYAHLLMDGWSGSDMRSASVRLVMVVLSYLVVSTVMRARRGKSVLEDERDRQIEIRATQWARGALVACMFGVMFVLAFSPAYKLQWATPPAIATMLLFALVWSWLVEAAAKVAMYWWDRR